MSKREGVFKILDVFDRPDTITKDALNEPRKRHAIDADKSDKQPEVENSVAGKEAVSDRTETITPEPPEENAGIDDRDAFLEPEELTGDFNPVEAANANPANFAKTADGDGKTDAAVSEPDPSCYQDAGLELSAAIQIDEWKAAIASFEESVLWPQDIAHRLHEYQKTLIAAARGFLDSPLAGEAVRAGWSAHELFAVHPEHPRTRSDTWGILANSIWGTQGAELIGFTANSVAWRSPKNAPWHTFRTGVGNPRQYGRPFWLVKEPKQ